MNANANVENVGSRYLFDKNETGLTLEDNLITTLVWDIQEKGHFNAFQFIGGNYIKLTKIPKGIKVYWNTQNNRAGAMLLDDVNRGVKISKQNKFGQLMTYRNYYLWSEGELAPDESNPNIILEFTGKGVEVEYLLGSATEVQLLADQFNTLNENLKSMVDSLGKLEISAEANANQLVHTLPQDFTWSISLNTAQINKLTAAQKPTTRITNHVDHYHVNLSWNAAQTAAAAQRALYEAVSAHLYSSVFGQLIIKASLPIEYSINSCLQLGFNSFTQQTILYDEVFAATIARGLQSLTGNTTDYNFYTCSQGSNLGNGFVFENATSGYILQSARVEGLRIAGNNQNNYTGLSVGNGMSNALENISNLLNFIIKYYASHTAGDTMQLDLIVHLDRIWMH